MAKTRDLPLWRQTKRKSLLRKKICAVCWLHSSYHMLFYVFEFCWKMSFFSNFLKNLKAFEVCTYRLELSCCELWKISYFLERFRMEHIELNCSFDSKVFFLSLCSIRIRSRKWDIFKKPQQVNSSRIWNRN